MSRRDGDFLRFLACVAVLVPAGAAAEPPKPPDAGQAGHVELAVSRAREQLSNDPNDWSESSLELLRKFGERRLLIGRLTRSERFGVDDDTLSLSGYHPLGARTTLYAEAAASDTHRVLPQYLLHLQLAHALGGGWGVIGGLKRLRYDAATVDVGDLTLEYYVADLRFALTALPSHSSSAGSASALRLQGGWYYDGESNVQLVRASGDEVDQPTGVGAVVKTSVRSTALFGAHWLGRDWAFTYLLGRTHQGATTRDAAGIGLRRRF